MTDNARRILELLSAGKITVDEADQLLHALENVQPNAEAKPNDPNTRPSSRWLRITIDKAARDTRPPKQVSIRVPMALVRSGVKLGSMIPGLERELDLSGVDFRHLERVLADAGETVVDIDEGRARVRVRCE